MVFRVQSLTIGIVLVAVCGCSNRPAPVKAPAWDPEELCSKALELGDGDADGVLNESELASMPGLEAGMKIADTDGDGSLSSDELKARVQSYKDEATGLRPMSYGFKYKGRPLKNAKVEMIPEPFLGNLVEPAEGVTDTNGVVSLKLAGRAKSGVRFGYYRIKVTSDDTKIPEKYNTATTLGVEISPTIDGAEMGKVFNLK